MAVVIVVGGGGGGRWEGRRGGRSEKRG